ncbi:TPA: hypothetical protein ACWLTD_000919 [Morganella morganii]|uniref:hypothetical protein n=1 Tax=Morganella morganii TaxID=582 RepID=UPI00289F5985|nr:hypothetical protein [Morganella morganii]
MKNSALQAPASRFVYVIVIVVALLQGLTLNATSDYLIRSSWQVPGSLVWLPMLLALFVPSVFSYLINRFSSAALWAGLLLTAILCVWMNFWYLSEATAGHTRELSSLIPLMVLLFWLILPWFQLRQLSGSWNPDYALLTEQYVRNTVLGALAGLIGLLVMGMLFLAVYLFRIVNLEFLSDWLNDSLSRIQYQPCVYPHGIHLQHRQNRRLCGAGTVTAADCYRCDCGRRIAVIRGDRRPCQRAGFIHHDLVCFAEYPAAESGLR